MKTKIIYGIVLVLLIAGSITINVINKKNRELKEKEMVEQYQECLADNFNQRDYCAKELGTDYRILDQIVESIGE